MSDHSSTRGLDSSTALEFVRALRIATDIARVSTIVSIYQASESLYQCFDKVCVIYEGRMAYYGPANQARQYFIDMGYEPANRQTTPDFLVAVTDSFGRIERPNVPSIPRTATDFAAHFQKSNLGQANRDDMDSYRAEFVGQPTRASVYIESVRAEHSEHTRKSSAYMISIPMQVRAVMVRFVNSRVAFLTTRSLIRNLQTCADPMGKYDSTSSPAHVSVFWVPCAVSLLMTTCRSFILQGIIMGTVFLRTPEATSAYFSRGGVLFL